MYMYYYLIMHEECQYNCKNLLCYCSINFHLGINVEVDAADGSFKVEVWGQSHDHVHRLDDLYLLLQVGGGAGYHSYRDFFVAGMATNLVRAFYKEPGSYK